MESLIEYTAQGSILHDHFHLLVEVFEWIAALIDLAAIVLVSLGALRFILGVIRAELTRDDSVRVRRTNRRRIELGRYILASLELFIVSDIIHTALSLAFADIMFLGLLVIIRSITSYFLDRELDQLKKELLE